MGELRIGSMFSGYGGLDRAMQMVCGSQLAWVCDNDPAASKILTHHYPNVPNLGDVTAVDWSAVPPADVLTAGFPCQPVSQAGKRKATADGRWLFDEICKALRGLDPPPRLCLFENVAGLLSANRGDAMARVIHGLAESGYVGRWRTVRASDAGAPHRRERVFILAFPAADSDCEIGGRDKPGSFASRQAQRTLRKAGGGVGRGGNTSPVGGDYAPVIHRWGDILGRSAPPSTEPGRTGQPRLSPSFVEWMMGLPAGWVTDVPGLSRNDQLKALGNGVVPQQAALALALLLNGQAAA